MINKRLDAITYDDLVALQENRVRENISLEYKQALPGNGNEEKKEFLRDVIALANTVGGDMVFGVAEQRDQDNHSTGEVGSIDGVTIDNYDALTLRFENMIRDSIAPRLVGTTFKQVVTPDGLDILIIRIPQSLVGPHMLTMQTKSPFYGRNNGGKFELDVYQIRDAFLQTDAFEHQFKSFTDGRFNQISEGDTSTPLLPYPKLVVHTMPLLGGRNRYQVDPQVASNYVRLLYPPGSGGADTRYNFDGFLVFDPGIRGQDEAGRAYTQVFRNGFLEYVTVDISIEKELFGSLIEKHVLQAIQDHLNFLNEVGIVSPAFVAVGLTGLHDHQFREVYQHGWRILGAHSAKIDRQQILLPPTFVESTDVQLDQVMKPAFDVMWQASGLNSSPFYNEDGSRNARA